MGCDVNVVEKSQRESDSLGGAAGDFASAYLADEGAKDDRVEEHLREGATEEALVGDTELG
jgi:hypothetical protein